MLSQTQIQTLFKATRAGQLDQMKPLIEIAGTEQKNDYGWTPLMMASLWGHLSIVKYLIQQKANIYATGKMGLTPIMLAALQKKTKIVDILYPFYQAKRSPS